MAGPERQLHVDSAQLLSHAAVFVLGINDVHLRSLPERSHRDRRQEIGLAGSRMSEHPDVGVGVTALIKRINKDRRACCLVASENKTALLL